MSVIRAKRTLQKNFTLAWGELGAALAKMGADCEVKPSDHNAAFEIDENDGASIKVDIRPVVFRLPEKAQSPGSKIFVTVKGKIHFTIDAGRDEPMAYYFATTVGYFRRRGNLVDHILGIHYDYDDRRAGHPVFHAQLKSCAVHREIINQHYREDFGLGTDHMSGAAEKVRLPTAHMDAFSVFVQLLADHLINENSPAPTLATFEQAREKLMFFKSDPDRSKRLDVVFKEKCFRGPRWYPEPAAATAAVKATVQQV